MDCMADALLRGWSGPSLQPPPITAMPGSLLLVLGPAQGFHDEHQLSRTFLSCVKEAASPPASIMAVCVGSPVT